MKSLSRGLSLLALLAWGTLMLYFYFSGRLAEYLIPAYRPLVGISGGLMLLIAGTLAAGYRFGSRWQLAAGPAVEDCPDDFAGPGRVRATQLLAFALLVVPLWAAASISKDQYNAAAMKNRVIVTDASNLPGKASSSALPAAAPAVYEPPLPGATPSVDNNSPLDASQYLKKTPSGHILIEVTDLLFAAEDETMRPSLENKTVELIGQYMPLANGNLSGKRFQLARMFMVCCAADARPVAVAVEPAAPAKLDEMAWTRVVGKVTFPLENGRRQAVIQAESATPSDPPSEAMLY